MATLLATATATRPTVDASRPALARLVNYWLGGKDHFAADRHLADQITRIHPGIPHGYRAARQAAIRTVAHLATDGIRQFVDLGPGLPTPDHTDTHCVAQNIAPTSAVVYVDHDPLVLAHCRALHVSDLAGAVTVVDADATQPAHLTTAITDQLDPTAPVAVLATSLAHHLDDQHLRDLFTRLTRHLPDGSRIVVTTHTTRRGDQRLRTVQQRLTQAGIPYHRRPPAQIAQLLHSCGLTLPAPAGPPPGQSPRPGDDAADDNRDVWADAHVGRIDTGHHRRQTDVLQTTTARGEAVDVPR
ncbi:S-adenosyl methyltransferase [Micromonospora sp. Llam0]|uniref:SAM-dependent methyltransferase n=1 Tax=Micromonospora sp. Llam0 TaxID=2485143 RepID=UPI000F495885|nr:SAM-dependent methyltransferase [Micromonospora sp. Llam0]ROO52690.1 S-adenosyl methyltransferase [Micromonospora sp. Llam0]